MKRIKHTIRKAYGYTDFDIIEHIGKFGQQWAIDAYESIMEDEDRYWQLMISSLPLARTPMDKKSSKSMGKYAKELQKSISRMLAPWIEQRRIEAIRIRLSKPPQSITYDEHGNVVDLNDPDWWKKEV